VVSRKYYKTTPHIPHLLKPEMTFVDVLVQQKDFQPGGFAWLA
jgi:hypothetical protein